MSLHARDPNSSVALGLNLLQADNFERWFISIEVMGESMYVVSLDSLTCLSVGPTLRTHRRARCSRFSSLSIPSILYQHQRKFIASPGVISTNLVFLAQCAVRREWRQGSSDARSRLLERVCYTSSEPRILHLY